MFLKFTKIYSIVVVILFNTFLFLLLIEAILSLHYSQTDSTADSLDRRANFAYYQSQTWGEQYWLDFANQKSVYSPYVVWKRDDIQTETFNIIDGIRVTSNTSCEVEDAYTVYVLGGSTVYGAGSPDWLTLPSFLQEKFNESMDVPVCVVNLGVSAYVSTQERIRLEELLVRGDVPDLVIAYNGLNDVISTIQNKYAGWHHNLPLIADTFNNDTESEQVINLLNSNIARALGFDSETVISSQWQSDVPQYDEDTLAQQTADLYLENARILTQLGQLYGFDVYYFWQPSLYTTKKVFSEEEKSIRLLENWDMMFDRVDAIMKDRINDFDNVYYLTNLFDDIDSTMFIDQWHVIPPGNELVANRIFETVVP